MIVHLSCGGRIGRLHGRPHCMKCGRDVPLKDTADDLVSRSPETEATVKQPDPTGLGQPITPLVIDDLKERERIGTSKYGTRLRANNGRNSLVDAYQEALDLCCYLRQAIEESK